MITITRDQARQLRAVLRRGFGRAPQGNFSGALLAGAPSGITARAWNDSLAVEFRIDGAAGDGQALVPLDMLESCQARSQEPVKLDWSERGGLSVLWTDRGVAQLAVRPTGKLPTPPEFLGAKAETTQCGAGLWQALGEAVATAADESARFALHAIQLRGLIGQVVATDGRQVLVQGGFRFPWPDSVLIPAARLFTGREITPTNEITVGIVGDWVSFAAGRWTVWLKRITDRKYPDVRAVIPALNACPSRLSVSDGDAAFLIDTLPALPVDNPVNSPVTLDLNGRALVRARASADGPVTQLNLAGSHLTGSPLTIHTNRDYLLRALRLGFRQLAFQSPQAPVVCSDDARQETGARQYVWAVLSPEDAIPATEPMQELVAPEVGPSHKTNASTRISQRSPVTLRKTRSTATRAASPAPTTPSATDPLADATPCVASPSSGRESVPDSPAQAAARPSRTSRRSAALDHALDVRSLLRETLVQMDGLVGTLRQQRKQSQLVRSTLKSLRQLERVAG